MGVPSELLAHDLDHGRVLLLREPVDRLGPERHGETEQQQAFDRGDTDLRIGREVGAGTDVISLRVGRTAMLEDGDDEERQPPDEQGRHQQMDVDQQFVEPLAVGGGDFGEEKELREEFHRTGWEKVRIRGRQ